MGMAPAVKALEALVQGGQINGVPVSRERRGRPGPRRLYGATERIAIRKDPGGSSLAKSRARAFHWAATELGADVWIFVRR